jgi:hypothetical protein
MVRIDGEAVDDRLERLERRLREAGVHPEEL